MNYSHDDDDEDDEYSYGGGGTTHHDFSFTGKWGEEDEEDDENDHEMNKNDDLEYQDNQTIIEECKEVFKGKDFIMETAAITKVQKFLKAEGKAEDFVALLAENYHGVAQLANLLADWLIVAGCSVEEVQEIVERHLKDLIIKNFDPKKADSIFTGSGQPPGWIEEMITHPPWRIMFYELSDKYPDCLMLNYTIKMISDAGYQTEMGTMSSAFNQIDVFSKFMKTFILNFYTQPSSEIKNDFIKSVCHGKHTYLYAQCMLNEISMLLEQQGLSNACLNWMSQEISTRASKLGHDIWPLVLLGMGAGKHPRVYLALMSLVEKKSLNPGDITVLYKAYSVADPPPAKYLRIPAFLDLLVNALFQPGSTISADHKPKYLFLMAYAVSAYEQWEEGIRESVFTEEVKQTLKAIEVVHRICSNDVGSSTMQLTADFSLIYQCIRYPIISVGIIHWIKYCFSDTHYHKVITDSSPFQVVLLDEINSSHPLLHSRVLELLKELFERNYPQLDTLIEIEFKKTLIDRMIHMLSRGYILPVVSYIKDCMDKQLSDVSLLRHFVVEVLEMIAPPYSPDFISLMLPIVKNKEITDTLRTSSGEDDVSQFLSRCENG
ncbi:negative elongation factor D-like [Clytia hemisphaerica]